MAADLPINGILQAHLLWLGNPKAGRRADLTGMTLNESNFARADLRQAILNGVTLLDANLTQCDMTGACLDGAIYSAQIWLGSI